MIDLKNKEILLGVSGGIAAYKAAELLRLLKRAGAGVRVVMTRNAAWFVGPMTFEALSGRPVCIDLFEEKQDAAIKHIEWAQEADALVIAPATANIIGKLANGIADDALSTIFLAATCPVIICPAMNSRMYEKRMVQKNLELLGDTGCFIVEPGAGELACGASGPGRLAEPEVIMDRLTGFLTPKDFRDVRFLVTAGPTREFIDPVRFISNPSSGKMGYALARVAESRGGRVTLICGPTSLPDPYNVKIIAVKTAGEMADAVIQHAADAEVIVKAAAVGDYCPVEFSEHKLKKDRESMILELKRTPDILKTLGERKKPGQILVGFAAETRDLEKFAREKLESKNLDMIAGNIVGSNSSGFETDINQVTLYLRNGTQLCLPLDHKLTVAHGILDCIRDLMGKGLQ
jgi:phosphopantothenoylcysteine decarboxylase/phosphopantothenate--cysteine ligase